MSYQITKVDLIPNGEIVKCNASQFDNGRVLPFEMYENKVAYNIPNNIRVELHCRKPDGNIVTLPSDTITDNIVTFITTTQLTACYGDNVCEIALYGADDYLIGSANFILEVEKSPTYGGINSTSAIHNLESQIRDIAEDVIPEILPDYLEDYYTKSEVDALIDNIFPTFTASGAIASFVTALNKPLVSVTAAEGATTVTRCGRNLYSNIFSEYRRPVNYYIKNIPLKIGETYTIKATLKSGGTPIRGGLIGLAAQGEQYSEFLPDLFSVVKTDGTTASYTLNVTNVYTSPKLAVYVSSEEHFNNIFENYDIILVSGTDTSYQAYTGNTVSVAESTTLITQSGVNNVFADVGAVTVGYKYMSMPETPTNSNRLALSSVRSDIIKEKSEIEEQSDIIEDIERGEKNE